MPQVMQPVESSNIKAVGHDSASNTLTVQFHGGAKHAYADVPAEKHAGMMAADSVGSYFHKHIRNAHKSTKLDAED